MFFNLSRQIELLLAARKRRRDRQELMTRAVDAVVAGTDPRIRAISGYRKKLRPAVRTAALYVQGIVERIPGPIVLAPSRYGTDPTVHAWFSSVDDLRSQLARSAEVHTVFSEARGGNAKRVYAFLVAQRQEKNVFAPAMVNGMLRHDVAQTMVSFADRRVVEPADSGYLARRQLMRRAFFDLIASALEHLATLQEQHDSSTRTEAIKRTHLHALRQKREGFEDLITGHSKHDLEIATLEHDLPDEKQNEETKPEPLTTLEDYLDRVVEVFANPEEHLPFELTSVHLTRMNRKLPPGAQDDVNEIRMGDAHNSRGDRVSVIAVWIPRAEMPEPAAPPKF